MSKIKLETGLFTTPPPHQLLGYGTAFQLPALLFFKGNWKAQKTKQTDNKHIFWSTTTETNFVIHKRRIFLSSWMANIFAPIILKCWCIFLNFHSNCLHLVIFWGGKKLKWVPLLIIYVLNLHNSCRTAPLNTSSPPRPILKSLLLYETDKYDSQYSPHSFPQASWDVMHPVKVPVPVHTPPLPLLLQ